MLSILTNANYKYFFVNVQLKIQLLSALPNAKFLIIIIKVFAQCIKALKQIDFIFKNTEDLNYGYRFPHTYLSG